MRVARRKVVTACDHSTPRRGHGRTGDYLSDRWVIYEDEKWSFKEEMTCDAPQGSRVDPLVWNVMYDDFLRMDLPVGTIIIGFADDALVICVADEVRMIG